MIIGVFMTAMIVNAATLYNVTNNGVKIVLDGKKLNPTDANGNKVEPIIYNGTTYLPVRAIATALGKEVYWDGPNYTVYLGDMDGKLQYPSAYLKDNNIGGSLLKAKADRLTDNYGNTYDEALYYDMDRTAEYLLDMKYSSFKGTLYVPKNEDGARSFRMKVVADGKLIYTSPEMTKISRPVDFDVNVKGSNHIKVELDFSSSGLMVACIGDAGFYQ